MRHVVAGIVAHVDAGKTTLSEALLYRSGGLRRLGRVDHGDAFLDTEDLEKRRGITIHAHQARVTYGDLELTLLDTPGHVDFAAETERVLRVLDCAILVVSAVDGVQGHTETLWRLLDRYRVPTVVFVNKCDADTADPEATLDQLRARLSDAILPVDDPSVLEDIATLDEAAADEYLADGTLSDARLRRMVAERRLFPVFRGAALRLDGVAGLLDGLERLSPDRRWGEDFGARVYKVSHDGQHNRLTWMRVTGGTLRAKTVLGDAGKADQLRVYNGARFDVVQEAPAGTVCAATGLTGTFPGQGLGAEPDAGDPSLVPVLTYTVLPADAAPSAEGRSAARTADGDGADGVARSGPARDDASDAGDRSGGDGPSSSRTADRDNRDDRGFDETTLHRVLAALREMEDEEPLLRIAWVPRLGQIHVQPMGEVQLDIIRQTLHDRFGLDVGFGPGGILYRETIDAPMEGVGHYEPLKHYAEAHILLEPGEPGSGVTVASAVSEDVLDRNWQRLVLTHLTEREHCGVLIGAPLTDIRMTLVAGRAHLKHTEGGDFRQATYRAIRQGLMELRAGESGTPRTAEEPEAGRAAGPGHCRVLEPWYRFRLEVPQEMLGRAMSDVQRMSGTFSIPEGDGNTAVLVGECPVAGMRDYARDVGAYTHGRGRLSCTFGGYRPCHDEAEVIAAAGYDPEADPDGTPDSVFCAHGAGYPVKWYRVPDFMHLPYATA